VKFKTRTRGTKKQVGKRFPVLEKKKLPPKIQGPIKTQKQREAIAVKLGNLPVAIVSYKQPTEKDTGKVSILYDGHVITNRIHLVETEPWVASWDRLKPVVYVHKDVPGKYHRPISIHETIEKYICQKYGLSDKAEGHEASETAEMGVFADEGFSNADWIEYMKIVERIHREELDNLGVGRSGSRNAGKYGVVKKYEPLVKEMAEYYGIEKPKIRVLQKKQIGSGMAFQMQKGMQYKDIKDPEKILFTTRKPTIVISPRKSVIKGAVVAHEVGHAVDIAKGGAPYQWRDIGVISVEQKHLRKFPRSTSTPAQKEYASRAAAKEFLRREKAASGYARPFVKEPAGVWALRAAYEHHKEPYTKAIAGFRRERITGAARASLRRRK